jgi:hypothetical protein
MPKTSEEASVESSPFHRLPQQRLDPSLRRRARSTMTHVLSGLRRSGSKDSLLRASAHEIGDQLLPVYPRLAVHEKTWNLEIILPYEFT